jgi:ATP-dependent DNA ligase
VSPVTADADEAREWLDAFKSSGAEGLVVKGASTRYQPGRRNWVKVKHRETVDVIVGAVTGSLRAPEVLVVGRYRGKELEVVGRTVKLKDDQAAEIGKLLKPAGPRHPWPDEISTHWGKGGKTPLIKVQPRLIVEVAADAALQAGQYRHRGRRTAGSGEGQAAAAPAPSCVQRRSVGNEGREDFDPVSANRVAAVRTRGPEAPRAFRRCAFRSR